MHTKQKIEEIITQYNFYYASSNLNSYVLNDDRVRLINDLLGTPIEKAVFLLDNMFKSYKYGGDICEFGVAQGRTSALLAYEMIRNGHMQKILHLYDSFKGLPKPTEKDTLINDIFKLKTMDAYTGTMACPIDQVKKCLSDVKFPEDKYKIYEGFVNKDTHIPDYVCFAYLDFDLYEPIKLILDKLFNRMCRGGRIVVDDYGFFSSGVKTAVDEFYDDQEDYELEVRHTQACLVKI